MLFPAAFAVARSVERNANLAPRTTARSKPSSHFRPMKIASVFISITVGLLGSSATLVWAAVAQDLTWAEMARRPELWPPQCTVKETMKFDGGATVQAGQKVNANLSPY